MVCGCQQLCNPTHVPFPTSPEGRAAMAFLLNLPPSFHYLPRVAIDADKCLPLTVLVLGLLVEQE